MSNRRKYNREEVESAKRELRKLLPVGSTVWTIIQHVSRSGMQRSISLVIPTRDYKGKKTVQKLDYLACKALGYAVDQRNGGLKIGGCGMDMGFHLVYTLARVIRPKGHRCRGERCTSSDHSNGMARDTLPRPMHKDGGYSLRHASL